MFLTSLPILTFSQEQPDQEILEKIVQHEFQNGSNYIECIKSKTHFETEGFKSQNGSQVPEEVLNELQIASQKSIDTIWDKTLFAAKNINAFIHGSNCMTTAEVRELFEITGKRQRIVSISDPIFDSDQQHCVVSIVYTPWKQSFSAQTYFLKKVYGVWTIIYIYDFLMS